MAHHTTLRTRVTTQSNDFLVRGPIDIDIRLFQTTKQRYTSSQKTYIYYGLLTGLDIKKDASEEKFLNISLNNSKVA
jgi:hypothetical protein